METKKTIWSTLTGGLTSAAPILLSCCKSGACVGVCASPIASIFGISSATIASSPLVNALEPLLIALSAVSFTISYYSLYVLPKFSCNTGNSCDCGPSEKEKRKTKTTKLIFWIGLILSIGFLSYFEYSKYQSSKNSEACQTECSSEVTNSESSCGSSCDSTSSCGE
jgi:formate hydrogenlyase subunit 3/multisubunit Na+/H+ antiporter MnhD subunit